VYVHNVCLVHYYSKISHVLRQTHHVSVMKNFVSICILLMIYFSLLLMPGCNQGTTHHRKAGEVIELSGDGGWGYAGRFAYIANNMLFFSYLDQEGGSWVASYDFNSDNIYRNKIWEGQNDLHSANPLLIRPDGRIQVFLDRGGYTDTSISWKVSEEPYSVKSFGDLQESKLEGDILQGRQFYPMVHQASGAVYLIINALRDNELREAVMWKSPDGGDTWTEYNSLWGLGKGLAGNRCYTRAYIEGDNIHIATLRVGWGEPLAGNEIGMSEGIYYTRYNVIEESFFYANGSRAFGINDTPVYETKYFDEIWHWVRDGNKQQRALWSDIIADQNGTPYVAFAVQESVPVGESTLHEGYRATPDADGKWNFHWVATLARGWDSKPERKNYAIALDPEDPESVFVARSTSKEEDLSQVQRLVTADGGVTWQISDILSDEDRLTTVVIPRRLDQSERKFEALWLDGRMEGWRDYDTKVMSFKKH
jgi:hypothetical protein